jgi:hypothetical protein
MVLNGRWGMTRQVINNVQGFLTMTREDRVYQICDVEFMLRRHPPEAVIGFLRLIQKDFKKELKELIRRDKTHPKVNHLVVLLFRLKMAINTIRNAAQKDYVKEVA